MSIRIKTIQALLAVNEKLLFYPRLAAFYKAALKVRNPVIFDVGANKGQTIRFFLKIFPEATIYAFEPNQKLFNKLMQQFGALRNVILVNKGVSNINGKLLFHETITDETSTFEALNYDSAYLKMKSKILGVKPEDVVSDSYEVEVITLRDFISEHAIRHVHVLKVDTEGHELKCLQGIFAGAGTPVDYIQLEHHYDDMYMHAVSADEVVTVLHQNGFVLNKKIKHGFGDFDELLFKYTNQ